MEMTQLGDAIIGDLESGFGISVEERKRLTIGMELVAKPHILFLDGIPLSLPSSSFLPSPLLIFGTFVYFIAQSLRLVSTRSPRTISSSLFANSLMLECPLSAQSTSLLR